MADEATQDQSASADAQDATVDQTVAEPDDKVAGEEALGDPGKKALDTMKAEKRAALQEARDAKAERDALRAKLDGKEAEHAAEAERRKVEEAALAKANDRILKAEVRAVAANLFADPNDALLYLDLDQFEVGADGEVDAGAIKAAAENILKSKPYLAAQGGKRFTGDADGGARQESSPSLDEQIVAAEKAGNHRLAIHLKRQKSQTANQS